MTVDKTMQGLLDETVTTFVQNEIAPYDIQIDRKRGLPDGLFDRMADLGFLNAILPREYGGAELPMTSAARLINQLAVGNASVAVMVEGQYKTLFQLMKYGDEEIQREYLPRAQHEILAFSNTEPSGGSNPSGNQTWAKQRADGKWVINGDKVMITNGTLARNYIITTKTGEDEFTCFMVDDRMPGFSYGEVENFIGLRGIPCGEIVLQDVVVDEHHMIGKRGQGLVVFNQAHADARILMGAVLTGIMEHELAIAKEYANQRRAGQILLRDMQVTQEKIARVAMSKEMTRLAYEHAARMRDAGEPTDEIAAMIKCFGSQVAVKAGDEVLQLLGGYGYSADYPVEHLIRDARAMEIAEGTVEKMHTEISTAEFAKEG